MLYSTATDVNTSGTAVGGSGDFSGNQHAVRWSPDGTMTDLDTLPGDLTSFADGINRDGVIVGRSDAHAVRWNLDGTVTNLGTLPGGFFSYANDVNNAGVIVGLSQSGAGDGQYHSVPDEEDNLGLVSRLLRGPGRRVVACLRRAAPFAEALKGTDGLWLVGVLDEACRPDRIEADAIVGRAARAIHRRYVQERIEAGDTADTKASICDWEDLPSYLQESNYAQAEHIGVKLHEIGAGLTTIRPAQSFAFQPGEIEKLARIEHKRWMDERIAAGFVPGPRRTARDHPDLVDWPNLAEESRQRTSIR